MTDLYEALKAGRGLHTDDSLDAMFGRSILGGGAIYDGTLPVTLDASAGEFSDYKVYGAEGGAGIFGGEQLCPSMSDWVGMNGYLSVEDGTVKYKTDACKYKSSYYIDVTAGKNYRIIFHCDSTHTGTFWSDICFYANMAYLGSACCVELTDTVDGAPNIVTVPAGANRLRISFATYGTGAYAEIYDDTDKVYYVPLTVTAGGQTDTVNVPVGARGIEQGEYVWYSRGKLYLRSGSRLVPVDPPAAFPSFNVPSGEITIGANCSPAPDRITLYRIVDPPTDA